MHPQARTRCLSLLTTCLFMVGLCSCDDSAEAKRKHDAQFTTTTKAKPKPKQESLAKLVRSDKIQPATPDGQLSYPIYSDYKGEDLRQLTGVSGRSLIICFTAPWCPHSKKMLQALQQLAQWEKGKVQVVNINADAYTNIAQHYQIKKIPTSTLYVEGVQLRTIEGAFTADSIQRYLKKTLSTHNTTQE